MSIHVHRRLSAVAVLFLLILSSVVCPLSSIAGSAAPQLTGLHGTRYYPAVRQTLNSATGSIHVAMYQARVYRASRGDRPADRLIAALGDAHRRGVKVQVILDHSFRYDPNSPVRQVDPKNDVAAERLVARGVDVRFAPSKTTMHAKLIVVDDGIVITGSHNWSHTALTSDAEDSVLIRSGHLARQKREFIERLAKTATRVPGADPEPSTAVMIPVSFMTDARYAPRMMSDHAERAFDVYLLLLKSLEGTNHVVSVDHDLMAEELGMAEMGRTAYRRHLTKVLKRLEDPYGLVTCKFRRDKNAVVTLGLFVLPRQPARRTSRSNVGRPTTDNSATAAPAAIPLPAAYWDHGWSGKLTFAGKFAYLVTLREAELSATRPAWSVPLKVLCAKYGLDDRNTIGKGLSELEQQNLLQITRGTAPIIRDDGLGDGPSYARRPANMYRPLLMLSEKEIEDRWKQLIEKYDAKRVEEATVLATKLQRGRSHDAVENIIQLIDRYGLNSTKAAVGKVAAFARTNPRRHLGYVTVLLKRQ